VLAALVPADVVTVTSTAPAADAGVTAVIEVALLIVNEVAFAVPNLTAVAPVKSVPAIVTVSPPTVLPLVGLILVTAGGAAGESVCPLPPQAVRKIENSATESIAYQRDFMVVSCDFYN
jgi:hypothetical protein